MGACGMGEGLGVELGGRQTIAPLWLDLAAALDDCLGDGGLYAHGVDGDQRALQLKALQQQDGDDIGFGVAQGFDPAGETGLEQFRVKRIDRVAQRIMGWNAALIRQKPTQEAEPLLTLQLGFDKIIHPAQRRAEHQKQDFGQRINDPPALAGVRQGGKMIENCDGRNRSIHG